jgi:hypothetical protein
MNYELAKQLKDAGFLQELRLGSMFYSGVNANIETSCNQYGYECECEGWRLPSAGYLKAPTLSELIEACGENFYALWRTNRGWRAAKEVGHLGEPADAEAPTPEEAVALLWLTLNKQ